jgi:hypothetical protein
LAVIPRFLGSLEGFKGFVGVEYWREAQGWPNDNPVLVEKEARFDLAGLALPLPNFSANQISIPLGHNGHGASVGLPMEETGWGSRGGGHAIKRTHRDDDLELELNAER